MSILKRFAAYRVPALLYMGWIFYLSSGPITSPVVRTIPDYLLHSFGYAPLYVLVFWAIHEGLDPIAGRGTYWLPLVVSVLYGASDEIHQAFVPTRTCSLRDWLADALGSLAAAGVLVLISRIKRLVSPGGA
jgi:VanZ family protein